MRRTGLLIVALLGLASAAQAQTQPVIPGDRLAWTQQAATQADATGYTYLVKIDTNAVLSITTPLCVASTVTTTPPSFDCSVAFPAATPSVPHALTIVARRTVILDGKPVNLDSATSSPALNFQLEFVPATPTNVRRQAGA